MKKAVHLFRSTFIPRKEPDQGLCRHIHAKSQKSRGQAGPERNDPSALPEPSVVSGPEILTGEGGHGSREGGNGHAGNAHDLSCHGGGRHKGRSLGIDQGLA